MPNGILRVSASQGIMLKSSNSVTEESSVSSKIFIPSFKANIIQYPENLISLVELDSSILIEIKEKRSDWEKSSRQQQDFIQSQRVEMNQDDAVISVPWHISNTSFIQNLDGDIDPDLLNDDIMHSFEESESKKDIHESFERKNTHDISTRNYDTSLRNVPKIKVADEEFSSDQFSEFYDVEDCELPYVKSYFKKFQLDESCLYSDPNVVFFYGSAKNAYSLLKPANFLEFLNESENEIIFHSAFLDEKEDINDGIGLRKTFSFASGDLKDLLSAQISHEISVSIDPKAPIIVSLLSMGIFEVMISSWLSQNFFLEETLDDIQESAYEIFKLPERKEQKVLISSSFSLFVKTLVLKIPQNHLVENLTDLYTLFISCKDLAFSRVQSGNFDQRNIWKLDDSRSVTNLAIEMFQLDIAKEAPVIETIASLITEKIQFNGILDLSKLGSSLKQCNIDISSIKQEFIQNSVLVLCDFGISMSSDILRFFELFDTQMKAIALWWISILEEAIHNGSLAERSFRNQAQSLFIWELYHGALESSFQSVASKDFSKANIEQFESFPRYDDAFNNYCYLDSAPFGVLLRKLTSTGTTRRKFLNPFKSGISSNKLTLPTNDVSCFPLCIYLSLLDDSTRIYRYS
jgi:hypothetical protein